MEPAHKVYPYGSRTNHFSPDQRRPIDPAHRFSRIRLIKKARGKIPVAPDRLLRNKGKRGCQQPNSASEHPLTSYQKPSAFIEKIC